MSERDRWSGIFVPVTTPFDEVTGDPAPVALREGVKRLLEAGVDGIVLFGSTGEGDLLDAAEKVRLTGLARDRVPASRALVCGAAAESTRGTIRLAERLADAGADAVLVHPPWYYGPFLSPDALRAHFEAVADASPVPVLLYHMPKYTRVTLEAGLVGELAQHPNVPALKDSSGDLKRLGAYIEACGAACRVLVGSGTLIYAALETGAAGAVVAVGNLAPEACVRIAERYAAGDTGGAGAAQELVAPLHREIVGGYGVPGVKAALDTLGLAGGRPRPPLRPLGAKARAEVARVLREAGMA
ncbi:MAG: dihydrodipicolinate synthase family protein [Gemmatimonadota bacterium]